MRRTFVVTLLIAAACLGSNAIGASSAQAHTGDYSQQRSVTMNAMLSRCRANWGGFCPDWRYDGAGAWGAHSRYFVWQRSTAGGRLCDDTYYIGHSNVIFSEYHYCR